MQDIIGKKYQYRLIEGEIKTIQNVQGDTVIFDDGGRVPLNRLEELFAPMDMTADQARKVLSQSGGVGAMEELDPNSFFNNTHNSLLQQLKKEAEKIDTTQLKNPIVTTNTAIKDIVNEPPVKKIIVETDEETGKTYSHEENAAPSTNDFLKKMKRNTEVEINVKIVEHIPNLDFIKMMDENFDQGVLEYLIEDITKKITSSPNIVQAQVREQLNNMLNKKQIVKPKRKKSKNEGNNKTAQPVK